MAGLHDASGPASSGSFGIAVQKTGELPSSDKGKLRVFISYSREDLDFADQLAAALDSAGFECLIDREGISGGEDWKRRLGNLISEADTVVFVLSPSSAQSEICAWEVEEAARLNKRIFPANWRPLEGVSPPTRLRDLNYIFFYKDPKVPGSGFGTGLASLVTALNTDFDWLREHTRYLQRAIEWDKGGRPANRLLSGNDILEAKTWAARRPKSAPEPTALHLDFIRTSEEEAEARLGEQRKQLEAVAAAQAERETALHKAEEALMQAADAQRRRTMNRNTAFVLVSGLAGVALVFSWIANEQRMNAEEQQNQADVILARSTNIISKFQKEMDPETKKEALAVLKAGADHGSADSMNSLGISYAYGFGVEQDYIKAREWWEKAAAKDHAGAMIDLSLLFENGRGVTQDQAKAREWSEKAHIYKWRRGEDPYHDSQRVFARGVQVQEALAANAEAEETERDGKPGNRTAQALSTTILYTVLAKEFTKALTAADRSHARFPNSLAIEASRAHALMFMEHGEEAKALYLAHKGQQIPETDKSLWEQVIARDFELFRKAGRTHPMMADIEKELGISR